MASFANIALLTASNRTRTNHSSGPWGLRNESGIHASLTSLIFWSLLGILLITCTPAKAQFEYVIRSGACTITGYTGLNNVVTIPDHLGGRPVTAIGSFAFSDNWNLTSIFVPATITNLEPYALGATYYLETIVVDPLNPAYSSFDGALFNKSRTTLIQLPDTKTANYTIPNGVTNILESALGGSVLTNITLPSSITSVGNLFSGWPNELESIAVDPLNPNLSSLDGVLFTKDRTTLLKCPAGKQGNYKIPSSVLVVASDAFNGTALTNITISSRVGNIGEQAFGGTSLEGITVEPANEDFSSINGVLFNKAGTTLIYYPRTRSGSYDVPSGVTNIGNYAFYESSDFTGASLPSTLQSIGDHAFGLCRRMTDVTIPDSVNTIGNRAFYGCSELQSIIFGDHLASLGESAFAFCPSLALVELSKGTTNIGVRAFYECSGLQNMAIPANVSSIGEGAFSRCTSLKQFSVETNSNTFITHNGVLFSNSQTSLVAYPGARGGAYAIGTNVHTICASAFMFCSKMDSITIPNSVTNIDYDAFRDCSFNTVSIPNSVSHIGRGAFSGCLNLSILILPDSISQIEQYAFSSCYSLRSVTVPPSVTNIAHGAFSDCPSLEEIYFLGDAPTLGYDVFLHSPVTVHYQPHSTGWGATFGDRPAVPWLPQVPYTYITINGTIFITSYTGFGGSVAVPATISGLPVTQIGDRTFASCTNLSSLVVPGSVTNIGDGAFLGCSSLAAVYFLGTPPATGPNAFYGDTDTAIYYMPGAAGWGSSFSGRPAGLWNPQIQSTGGTFGVRNGHFGFTITSSTSLTVLVEATTNLLSPVWVPVGTNTVSTGSSYFSDPGWSTRSARFYRLRSP